MYHAGYDGNFCCPLAHWFDGSDMVHESETVQMKFQQSALKMQKAVLERISYFRWEIKKQCCGNAGTPDSTMLNIAGMDEKSRKSL